MTIRVVLLNAFAIIMLAGVMIAQENVDCPVLVMDTIVAIDDQCQGLGRNKLCYGNPTLEADAQPTVTDLVFGLPGDVAGVDQISALRLSGMNTDVPEWGVALMRIQANLPDTMPGQNVTFLLFGDVQISEAQDPVSTALTVTATTGVNVRMRPVDGQVMTTLISGQEVIANGRLDDGSWIRIQLPDDSDSVGWVSANYLRTDGDLTGLVAMEPGVPVFGPMQAFYFRSGVGDTQCAEAPESGMLIQTPSGLGRVELVANEVTIQLGSTAFLQADPGNAMTITILDGSAMVEAQGTIQTAPAGTRVQVALDNAGLAASEPSSPEPYDQQLVQVLPVGLLPEGIAIRPAMTEPELDEFETYYTDAPPGMFRIVNGTWTYTETGVESIWFGEAVAPGAPYTEEREFSLSEDLATLYITVFGATLEGRQIGNMSFEESGPSQTSCCPVYPCEYTRVYTFTSPTTLISAYSYTCSTPLEVSQRHLGGGHANQ